MNTHDKKSLSDVRSFVRRACNYEITVSDAVNRILAAIEPYQRRIAELESQLEAVGAGGVPLMGCQQCTKLKVVLQAVLDDKATVLSRGVYDQIREALA